MNPIKTIGRFEIPIASVVMTKKRTGFLGWLFPGYDVLLIGGATLRISEEEKAELDHERELHLATMEVMATVGHMQRNNSPGR